MSIDPKRKPLIDVFMEYNQKVNLSAIRDEEGIYTKHILDSIEVCKIREIIENDIKKKGDSATLLGADYYLKVADIGTGGGFPLLPLAILYPQIHFVGIDSVRKKLQAISEMSDTLGIQNIRLERKRIEEVKEVFDIVTARAVGHISKLLPWTQSLLKLGSKLVLYKEYKEDEKAEMLQLLASYHLTLITEHRYTLFEGDINRVIYVLEKR